MPNLRIRDAGREFTYQIEADATTIGRAPTNTVEIGDSKASKEHCEIVRAGARWKLVDLESKNGTRVNGQFRNKAWLDHGDTVQIGAAEIRFGLEGAQRASAAPAAAARGPAPLTAADTAPDDAHAPPPVRRYRTKSNLPLVLSLAVLGIIALLFLLSNVAEKTQIDEYNQKVIDEANRLVGRGEYDGAVRYLQEHGDPSGNLYPNVTERIQEIRERKDLYVRQAKQQEAVNVLSRLARRIQAYNAGMESATAEEILALVERLKTEFAGTQAAADAEREWKAWWAGKVPQRASDLLASGRGLDKDWEGAVERADDFRKEWRFREARETIERFVTAREAVLDAHDLARYQRMRDDQLEKIDRLAESIYRGREAHVERLLKVKRYDEAIAVYREIVEKFGIDFYVRRAQAEIDKLEKLKAEAK